MGASESTEDQIKSGWRVLSVDPEGPSQNAGFTPFMDYIVGADGRRLVEQEGDFVEIIQSHVKEMSSVRLTVFNLPSGQYREVYVTPSRTWGGEGSLGLVIRFDGFINADEHAIHVLEVFDSSPSQLAGLIAHEDYLLGTHDIILKSCDDLEYLISKYTNHVATVAVYNAVRGTVREVKLALKEDWGGEGRLGCNVGQGLLHRLPFTALITDYVEPAIDEPLPAEPIVLELDESGTISFLISVLVPTTDQMITLPVVIYPTDASFDDYAAYADHGTSYNSSHTSYDDEANRATTADGAGGAIAFDTAAYFPASPDPAAQFPADAYDFALSPAAPLRQLP